MSVEFQLFTEQNRVLATIEMPVPLPGELVQIDGASYVVRGRGWVLTSNYGEWGAVAWVTLMPWTVED